MIDRRLSIAPMMDHTDRHFRYFMRLLSKQTLLYTEMITTGAILHGDRQRFLAFNTIEHPLALQLGGSDPDNLAECALIAEAEGYDEINLNIGCPSDRVRKGQFGACLMASPKLVAECVDKIKARIKIPVTIKTRIGIDEQDSYEFLADFIRIVNSAGCNTFILHARKAILNGLSPKENRKIPPLDYERVYKIKRNFPELNITINGGISRLDQIQHHLKQLDGVMLGRVAYKNPYILAEVDKQIFDSTTDIPTRQQIREAYQAYCREQLANGIKPNKLNRHIIGLYQGQAGARKYRRLLSNPNNQNNNGIPSLTEAIEWISK